MTGKRTKRYPLSGLGLKIKEHWKEHLPKLYRELEQAGDLDRSVYQAQEQTAQAYAELAEQGLPDNQAWEAVRELWAFLPSEKDQDEDAELFETKGGDAHPLFEASQLRPSDSSAPSSADACPLSGPAHTAMLLLATPDGELKAEFRDWEDDLLLEEGTLVPKWYPWIAEGKELSAEERSAQFKFDLDVLLGPAGQAAASCLPATAAASPPASHWTARHVLLSLLQLRPIWRRE